MKGRPSRATARRFTPYWERSRREIGVAPTIRPWGATTASITAVSTSLRSSASFSEPISSTPILSVASLRAVGEPCTRSTSSARIASARRRCTRRRPPRMMPITARASSVPFSNSATGRPTACAPSGARSSLT